MYILVIKTKFTLAFSHKQETSNLFYNLYVLFFEMQLIIV
jgi:hypothetical protein